ncbi:MAG TPA: hypothetical protein VGI03_10415 [Verrucomicrobiae bacterium]|jgi:hypothetical protein
MTRVGKIARLPQHVRIQLNRRLQNGEPGNKLVPWLNQDEDVQEVLEDLFASRPITKQNLSEWKQGGYVEWLKNEETTERVHRLAEHARDLDHAAGDLKISDRLGSILAAELADAASKLGEITDPEVRWKRFREILRELARLRHEDHQAQRVQMELEQREDEVQRQFDADCERQDEDLKERARDMLTAPMRTQAMAEGFGGGAHGRKMAEMIEILNSGQSLEKTQKALQSLNKQYDLDEPDPAQSGPVQPLLTKKGRKGSPLPAAQPSPTDTNPGQSGPIQPDPV